MFRSTIMLHYNLVMPRESAWDIINGLGEMGIVEIIDSQPQNAQTNRPFSNYIKRCDEILYRIEGLKKYITISKLQSQYKKSSDHKGLISYFQRLLLKRDKPGYSQLDEFEAFLYQKVELIETQAVNLKKLQDQLEHYQHIMKSLVIAEQQLGRTFFQEDQKDMNFKPHVGLISVDLLQQFQRVVFRITKGRAYVSTHEFAAQKLLYIVIYLSSSKLICDKLDSVCSAMALSQFELPQSQQQYGSILTDTSSRIIESNEVIGFTEKKLKEVLQEVLVVNNEAGCSLIELIRLYTIKERELYQQLNKLKMQGSLFIGDLWIPTSKVDDIQSLLQKQTKDNHPSGQLQLTPHKAGEITPTYFKVNDFTRPFQLIVDTYGIPRYQEFNPALITCVTFPFLFGVMFGDLFHGSCLLLFGLMLCKKRESLKNIPFWVPLLDARYMLVLMGFFSTYNGLIYNDFAGLEFDFFGSCYRLIDTQYEQICAYSFGIDPAWMGGLAFVNSLKMKLSVIIAYLHMTLGLVLMALNATHTNNKLGLTCKFIPQFLFLSCTFGYMDLLILIKWFTVWDQSSDAPSIINTMISMVLHFGSVDGQSLYNGQAKFQCLLIIVAIICVPWMWFPQIIKHMRNKTQENLISNQENQGGGGQSVYLHEKEIELANYVNKAEQLPGYEAISQTSIENHDDDFSEIVVHETIETIEFVLGCVSNTASYLRLWALSLAHSQLAEVFYSLLLADGVQEGSVMKLITIFPFWALVTIGVLLFMDTMECFLHALRLHWVEFQNKFYKGDGVPFQSFQFIELFNTQ